MLFFTSLPQMADGNPLLPGITAFPDHRDNRAVYYLPQGLTLLTTPAGEPDFFLLRYHGDFTSTEGGLLRFRLGFTGLEAPLVQKARSQGWELRETGFEGGRFRLRFRSLQEGQIDQLGDWRPVALAKEEVISPAVSLDARETQFLERLIAENAHVVDVELEMHYAGLVPGLPWMVTAETAPLKSLLADYLPGVPVRADQVVAAFLSLPESIGPVSWLPLEPDATFSSRESLLTEAALRSLDGLFESVPRSDESTPPRYRLLPPDLRDPPMLSWDLLPPRQEDRSCTFVWSVASLLPILDTPEKRRKLFPAISRVSPFADVDIHVLNRLPIDPRFLRKVVVDVRCSGASGEYEYRSFTFDGTAEQYCFKAVYPAVVADFQLAARITTTQAPLSGKGWPVVRRGAFTPVAGTEIDVSRSAAAMDFVRVEAEQEAFDRAGSIILGLYKEDPGSGTSPGNPVKALAEVTLTAAFPGAWVCLPGMDPGLDLYVRIVANAAGDADIPSFMLRQGKIVNRQVRIASYQLEVFEPERITVSLDPDLAGCFRMVRITMAPLSGEGRTYMLEAGTPVTWNFFRNSVFDSVRYRYRFDYVVVADGGHTQTMASTDWVTSQERTLVACPPLNGLGVHT